MTDIPTIVTAAGLLPTPPALLRSTIEQSVTATNPGYTADLPSSLIEDILSTDVGAVTECDSAKVETVNSLDPYAANDFLLNQLGQQFGVPFVSSYYTSVYVVFTGTVGYQINKGFTVGDGTYQYTVQDGGIIGAGGVTPSLFCVATTPGTWSVPTNTVNQTASSFPSTITLSVNNQVPGTPGTGTQTAASYRTQVLQGGLAVSQGMATQLKTALGKVSGVQPRLVSVVQQFNPGGWTVLCGGGDPYQVAYAIYQALFDVSSLVGSTLNIIGITKASNGVITTGIDHLFTTGQVINITGIVGMTALNGIPITVTVLTETTFSIGINTSGYPSWISGGVITPNLRNVSVSVQDYPNTYLIPFVNPPQQSVTMSVLWNTTSTNTVSQAAIAQAAGPAIVNYVNGLYAGVAMNLFELQSVFQIAVASILPPQLLTRMVFSVSIDGVGVSPEAGTGIIAGDPLSYFETDITKIIVTQG